MRVAGPRITTQGQTRTWTCDLRLDGGGRSALWFAIPDEHCDLLSDRLDAALVALLIPAMERGEDLILEGVVTDELIHRSMRPAQAVLQTMFPQLALVDVHASETARATSRAEGVATGFSGGIDSFCILADHFYSDLPDHLRVNTLLFNNVGSHGSGGVRLFQQRLGRIRPLAQDLGLPIVAVDSNLDDQYRIGFQQSHSVRNAATAFLLQAGIGRFLYASALHFGQVSLQATYDIAYADAVLLPLLSTSSLHLESVGSEYRRVDKTGRVAQIDDSYRFLDVCVQVESQGTNCSRCWKCLRTLLTLEVSGDLDKYRGVFDLSTYRRHRHHYLSSALTSHDPLVREVLDFGRERGFALPTSARLRAPATRTSSAVARRVRQGTPAWLRSVVQRLQDRDPQ